MSIYKCLLFRDLSETIHTKENTYFCSYLKDSLLYFNHSISGTCTLIFCICVWNFVIIAYNFCYLLIIMGEGIQRQEFDKWPMFWRFLRHLTCTARNIRFIINFSYSSSWYESHSSCARCLSVLTAVANRFYLLYQRDLIHLYIYLFNCFNAS